MKTILIDGAATLVSNGGRRNGVSTIRIWERDLAGQPTIVGIHEINYDYFIPEAVINANGHVYEGI